MYTTIEAKVVNGRIIPLEHEKLPMEGKALITFMHVIPKRIAHSRKKNSEFFALAGKIDIDSSAVYDLREKSRI